MCSEKSPFGNVLLMPTEQQDTYNVVPHQDMRYVDVVGDTTWLVLVL